MPLGFVRFLFGVSFWLRLDRVWWGLLQGRIASRRLILFVASGGGLGYVPVASGTFGSLLGVLLAYLLGWATNAVVPTVLILAAAVVFAVWVAGLAEVALEDHDSSKIVIDEIVGMAIALAWLPPTGWNLLVTFLVFRVLDVVKPWPASWCDRELPGGAGVVLDDVVSGIYANLLVRLIL